MEIRTAQLFTSAKYQQNFRPLNPTPGNPHQVAIYGNYSYLWIVEDNWVSPRFEVLFLEDARVFLGGLDLKTRAKILYNIDKARFLNDPKLFKKLTIEIWEFRTKYNGLPYRLLAFGIRGIK